MMIRDLGGVVHGKRHSYVIKVDFVKPASPERIELNRTFEVTTTDERGKSAWSGFYFSKVKAKRY
jgi:hypothetical protein